MNRYNIQSSNSNMQGRQNLSQYKKPLTRNSNIIGIALILLTITPLFVIIVLNFVSSIFGLTFIVESALSNQLFNIILSILSFSAATIFIVLVLDMPFKIAFPLKMPPLGITLGSIGVSRGALILGSLFTSCVYNAVVNFTGYAPMSPDFTAPRGTLPSILYFISMTIVPAIFEEALFRGAIMQSLRRFGDGFALIISSLLFGIMHGNLIQAPYSILIGLVLGYFVLYTGSLWPAIIMHFVNNAVSVVLDWFTTATTLQQDSMISTSLLILRIIIGVASILFLRHKMGSVFYIPPGRYPLEERDKHITFFTSVAIVIFLLISVFTFVQYLEPFSEEVVEVLKYGL